MTRNWKAAAFGLTLATAAAPAFGQINVLASFNYSNGAAPFAGLTLSGNTLYGTTRLGGAFGYDNSGDGYAVVFSVPITGGTPTVLTSFNGSDGANPYAGLTLSGNTL